MTSSKLDEAPRQRSDLHKMKDLVMIVTAGERLEDHENQKGEFRVQAAPAGF